MAKENEIEKMLDQLSAAYADEQVKQQAGAGEIILAMAKELEKTGNCDLVASKLSKEIVLYYWQHQKDFPAALITLHNQIKKRAVKYDATAVTAMMMPIWF
ncbi:bacteriocin immunity protein [Lactobacillus sp. UCMA15818]|uniref:bacteriocin immunity protein n=1 Tax=Lactobacillus sp. UCMA15818 TaxID=2583394 RepID=UPI0025B0B32D|nr:bacteriocin immunity protein [Lactobacillus sp. UCMA15818]MDN2453560.1 bacteriocin immunity protein [Lactobacillus sp. UCMA15818]